MLKLASATFGLKTIALGAAIAFAVGGYAGNKVTRWYYTSEIAAAKVRVLETRIRAAEEAAKKDRERAATAETARAEQEARANALQQQISDGVCFPKPDVERLRELWKPPAKPAAGRGRVRNLLRP